MVHQLKLKSIQRTGKVIGKDKLMRCKVFGEAIVLWNRILKLMPIGKAMRRAIPRDLRKSINAVGGIIDQLLMTGRWG